MKKNISLRTEEKITDELAIIYENTSKGAAFAVEAYPHLRRYTLNEIRGIFTKEELSFMVDNLNGLIMQSVFMINADIFISGLEDGIEYEDLENKWGVDFVKLFEKINMLKSAQVYFLQDEIRRFWQIPTAYGSPSPDLDKLIQNLC